MSSTTMSADDDSQLMNYLVRMITPMRREFGRSLDVRQFLHDVTYAHEVMQQALGSQDPRLREYATYVQQRYHGPRVADSPGAAASVGLPAKPVTAGSAPAASDALKDAAKESDKDAEEEAELRARMLKKYTDGLR